jgi:hypothetical protein
MIGREQRHWQFQSPMGAGSVASRSGCGTPGHPAYAPTKAVFEKKISGAGEDSAVGASASA